ncbi:hypothetical protein MNBD_BACTEROID06-1453 [hydrothermal vent metagenome]|uniref:Uncharacterized protein n=1 Tax=hydrothermal vent metagenome TaxID=652676 RepID=A0A3B0V671_9ZZZZ
MPVYNIRLLSIPVDPKNVISDNKDNGKHEKGNMKYENLMSNV